MDSTRVDASGTQAAGWLRLCVHASKTERSILPSCDVNSCRIFEKRYAFLAVTLTNESSDLAQETTAVTSTIKTKHVHVLRLFTFNNLTSSELVL